MNNIITLIYTSKGTSPVEKEGVYCDINSLSFREMAGLENQNMKADIVCVVNIVHDSKALSLVRLKGEEYTIIAKDRVKASDQIKLLLKWRKPNGG